MPPPFTFSPTPGETLRDRAPLPDPAPRENSVSSYPPHVDPDREPLADEPFTLRYNARALLGEGGMGEVWRARDLRVGREVAMKVLRPDVATRSHARRRFEREARLQGQLEHPSIVPVYDMGVGPDGRAYFTMKRVRGHTLERVLDGLREGSPRFHGSYSTRRLLAAFVQVCQAVAFAHARGVLHRDLKPANIMLGDYGEVYVLDWGIAKAIGARDEREPEFFRDDTPTVPPRETAHGAVMGTPGYISPEQAAGTRDFLDPRIDVYSLGAILFELLTLQPLHEPGPPQAVLLATIAGADARPSVRAPERGVHPALEAACMRATALHPDERFASVRELLDAVEAYLDGDRDARRRQQLADTHAAAADAAARVAVAPGPHALAARARALRELNRALALDPARPDALETLFKLMVDPPREIPADAESELSDWLQRGRNTSERVGVAGYLAWFTLVPFVWLLGVRDGAALAAMAGAIVLAAALSSWLGYRRGSDDRVGVAMLAVSTLAGVATAMLFGPFVLVPGIAAANGIFFTMHGRGKQRGLTIVAGALAVLIPVFLEAVGVLPPSYRFHDGVITILPRMAHFPPFPAYALLLLANLALALVPSWMVARVRDRSLAAETRVFLQLWQLRQLLPHGPTARGSSPAVAAESAARPAGATG